MKRIRTGVEHVAAGHRFPAGWRPVEYRADVAEYVLVRVWWWPFAIVWRLWSDASWRALRTLPKGRYA